MYDPWSGDIEDVAKDMLINAEHWVGGSLGICSPGDYVKATALLRAAGYIGPGDCLTKAGVQVAKGYAAEFWNRA